MMKLWAVAAYIDERYIHKLDSSIPAWILILTTSVNMHAQSNCSVGIIYM